MNEWTLSYEGWRPEEEPLREALCTIGNGYFATRGAAEESQAGGCHYPGTYLAGGYNRLETKIAGKVIENEDLVNWPNWLYLTFRPADGGWLDLDDVEVLDFAQELDMRRGLLERRVRFRDGAGRETSLESQRLVHMGDPHLAALHWELVPLNWSGSLIVRSGLDGNVKNEGVERYRDLASGHLETLSGGAIDEETIHLRVQTVSSHIQMAQAARTRVFDGRGDALPARRELIRDSGFVAHELELDVTEGKPIRVEKVVALYTSRDFAIAECGLEAGNAVRRAPDFEELTRGQELGWLELWHRCDVDLEDSGYAQRVLRVHIYHILTTISFNSVDLDWGVPSRGLHGEAYRGHVFWDELFIFPFLNMAIPELTRALLMYRYRRLPAARRAARDEGLEGALFPWQSGSDGREESQRIHLNPRSGRWIPDNTHLQRHVNAAIAYNIWQYVQATGDLEFLYCFGAEMLIELARFWASLVTYNADRERYEIRGVMGPDEYHDAYPDAETPGLDNNAYTNVMASWTLRIATRTLELLAPDRRSELMTRLTLSDEAIERWDVVSRRIFVPIGEGGIIRQFEGYEKLKELDWDAYHREYGEVLRLDRILEAENDTPNRYKAAKQADVLMLFYLFSSEELVRTFDELGYDFDPNWIPKNIDYYIQRTSHGSTLSKMTHSWVLSRSDRERSWASFETALQSDVDDIQGGTTPEGIHLGAMAGTVDIVQRCYLGVEMRDDVLWFNPTLPEELWTLRLRLRFRGHWVAVAVDKETLAVTFEASWLEPVRIGFRTEIHTLHQGETRTFRLGRGAREEGASS